MSDVRASPMLQALVFVFVGVACQRSEVQTADAAPGDAARGAVAPASELHAAEVTPELAAKAQELLQSHADSEFGTEIPFHLGGTRYVARIEEHENTDGDPNRPPGKHKGITVYVRK